MKKLIYFLFFSLICLNFNAVASENHKSFSYNNISTYKIENPSALEKSRLIIETEWDFFWGRFVLPSEMTAPDFCVKVPSEWNNYNLSEEAHKAAKKGKGAGTYRLRLTGLVPGQKYAIQTFELGYTAFTMYADGQVIYNSGTPFERWEKTLSQQYYDKAVFEADKNGSCLITVHVSNNFYRKGGMRHDFVLYTLQNYEKSYKQMLCNYSIFSGILITIITYCLLLALIKKDKTNLFLALFVLAIYSRIISSAFPLLKIIIPSIPLQVLFKIEYISIFMGPAFFALYMDSMNKKIFHHIPVKIVAAPSVLFFILDIALPVGVVSRMVPVMQSYMFMVIGLMIVQFLVRVIKNKDFTSTTAILSLLIILSGMLHDFFLHKFIPWQSLRDIKLLIPSFVLYAFIQTVLMAFIQNKNQNRVEELNENLTVLNNAYYRFVPKEFLNFLSKNDITEVNLGEYRIQKMAILSADIRNFTATSEKIGELRVFEMLNSYLARIAPFIRKNGGIIEKYLGDGIVAIFPDSAESALICAVQMQEEMTELRKEFEKKGLPPIKIGIGIHYGNIVLGTGGDEERMTEISLSKDIDIALNTEAETKEFKRPILATVQAVSVAATEAKSEGRIFDFCGKKLYDSNGNVLYALYTEKTGIEL